MAFNGSGVFNLVSGNPVVTGTTISSTWANNTLSDVATGLSNCVTRDGQSPATANLPMGGYKLTGLALATATGDALSYGRAATVSALTNSALTSGRVPYASTGGLFVDSTNLTFDGTTLTAGGLATAGTLTLSGGTANGIAYLNASKQVTSGSALTFDGTNFATTGNAGLGAISKSTDTQLNFYSDLGAQRIYLDRSTRSLVFYDATSGIENYRIAGITGVQSWGVGGSEQMRLTSTGLGIGTSSPSYKLDARGVVGFGDGANGAAYFNGGATAYAGLYFQYAGSTKGMIRGDGSGGALVFSGSGTTEQMRLDSSGNLGLGVTPSAWSAGKAIEIGNAGDGLSINYGAGLNLNRNAYYNGGFKYGSTDYASRYAQASGQHQWYTAPSGTAGNAISFSQSMTLDASGNLLVGTTSAFSSNSGRGNISINGSSDSIVALGASGTRTGYVYANPTQCNIGSSGFLVFETGSSSTERMRLDSSGNLLVGTTTPNARLAVVSSADVTYLQTTGSTSTCGYAKVPGNTAYYWLWQNSAGSNIAYIRTTDGTTVTYNTGSDERLKENITDSGSSLSKLNSIKVREFNWKSTGKKVEFGFIAQELNSVAPEAVSQGKNNVDGTIDVPWGVDNSVLVPALVKAIQELKAELDEFKSQLGK